MNQALWVAKTGLDAQQTRMAVIANNLANVNTTGFKKGRASFEDLLYQNVRQAGGQVSQDTTLPSGLMLGTGVRTVATEKVHTQGNLIQTNNALDVAIDGRGFLQVLTPGGSTAYTRDGSFKLNSQGQLVTPGGYPLQPAIAIPANAQSVTIGSDGVVSVQVSGSAAPTSVGNITLSDFINPGGLQADRQEPVHRNGIERHAAGRQPGTKRAGLARAGFARSSNVNVVEELVNMIEAQRAYEMNSKAIQASDQMLAYANNNL